MSKKSFFQRNLPKIIITALILAVLLYVTFFWGSTELRRRLPIKYEAEVKKYSQVYELDEAFVFAIICAESSFDAEAESDVGAKGLMQLMPSTARWLVEKYKLEADPEMLFDADTNILLGCQYLSYLNGRFDNDKDLVLAAYNGGEGNVSEWLKDKRYSDDGIKLKTDKIPDSYSETKNYVKKVNKALEKYKKLYNTEK